MRRKDWFREVGGPYLIALRGGPSAECPRCRSHRTYVYVYDPCPAWHWELVEKHLAMPGVDWGEHPGDRRRAFYCGGCKEDWGYLLQREPKYDKRHYRKRGVPQDYWVKQFRESVEGLPGWVKFGSRKRKPTHSKRGGRSDDR